MNKHRTMKRKGDEVSGKILDKKKKNKKNIILLN